MDGPCRLRPATAADTLSVAAIERAVFSDPWSAASIRESISMPWMFTWVAEDPAGRVVGYVFCREIAGESELLNLAVAPELRRSGVGARLLAAALDWARDRGARETFLEVRESNGAAIALYEREGFRAVGRRPGYYEAPAEDAILYRRPVPGRA
ncbi:MAG: ribosomal protein S18-alanine N-acetyltransferase [Gemmatimonadetes bacterium]|jgi:ribosomal-protein-alanine N-acetyltransferase|nr:ribosomal protein S18-alanine N-acetyltransferase [Gemmatimonadota bacterium]